MPDFYDEILKYKGFDFSAHLAQVKSADLQEILNKEFLSILDFLSLLSPEAFLFLELLAQKANKLTLAHFGKTISLYIPLYLSNYCDNECAYCGFKHSNTIKRRKLTLEEVEQEAREISRTGIQHILILTGESKLESPLTYIQECLERIKKYFTSIAIEIYPLKEEEYRKLASSGAEGLTIYQETYDEVLYDKLHLKGPKRNYAFRLGAPERAAQAGMRQVNVGALLGLGDFPRDAFFTALHAKWLQDSYPAVEVGISLPRIQPQAGGFDALRPWSDKEFVQLLIAMRLFLPRVGIAVSTRENNLLRKNIIGLGVTRISAGSRTEVGGYTLEQKTSGQFETADKSSVEEIKRMICEKGYQPVAKDWQRL